MNEEKQFLTSPVDRALLNRYVLLFFGWLNSRPGFRTALTRLVDKSLDLYPHPGPTQYVYGAGCLYLSGQRASAKNYFRRATEVEANSCFALRNQATAFLALRNLESAIECYEQMSNRYGKTYFAYSSIARLYRQMSKPHRAGRWRMVAENWEKALAANPKKSADWYCLGEAWLVLDELGKAREALKKADKRLPPTFCKKFIQIIAPYLYKAKRKFKKKSLLEKLIGGYTRRLVDFCLGTHAIMIWYALGRCYQKLGQPEQSHKFYKEAIDNSFSEHITYGGAGALHAREQNWNEAIAAFEKRFSECPELYDLPLLIGHIQRRLGFFQEAFQSYRKALTAGANKAVCLYYSGISLECDGQYEQAAERYKAATKLEESRRWPQLYYRLGLVQTKTEHYEAACNIFGLIDVSNQAFRWLLEERCQSDDNRQQTRSEDDLTGPNFWWRRGNEYWVKDNWVEAAQCFQSAIDREPCHCPAGEYVLGCALYRKGSYKQACEAFLDIFIDRDVFATPWKEAFNQSHLSTPVSYVHYRSNFPVRENVIVYESFDAKSVNGNPRAIFESRSFFDPRDSWLHIWAVSKPQIIPDEWRKICNVVCVPRNSQRYALFYATAKYIVSNSAFPSYFIRRSGQRVLNTWHGTPLKNIGNENKTRFNGKGEMQRNFLQASHLISPNRHTTNVLLDSYDLRNIHSGRLAETGYPRVDFTLNIRQAAKNKLRERLSLNSESPVVLFAPTWRGSLETVSFDAKRLRMDLEAMQGDGHQLIFRGHHLIEQKVDSKGFGCTVIPGDIDTNALLSIVDVLITDYSSICFDFFPRQKPVIYYAYDLEQYQAERGIYFSLQDLPGALCRDRESLSDALRIAVEEARYNADHDLVLFNSHDDGDATYRVIEFFMRDDTACVVHHEKDTRRNFNVLIHAGAFRNNGLSAAAIRLLNNVDRSRVNSIIAFAPTSIANNPERRAQLSKLDNEVDTLPRVGKQCITMAERHCLEDAQRVNFSSLSPRQEQIVERIFARELLRMTGSARLDALVIRAGYEWYWSALFAYAPADIRKIIYMPSDMAEEQQNKNYNLLSQFFLYHKFDVLVTASPSTRDVNRHKLARTYNIDSDRFIYAENVFDPAEVQSQAQQIIAESDADLLRDAGPIFITLGRLSGEKGHVKLIRSFVDVVQRHSKAKLLIVGHGPLYTELKQLVASLGMADYVHLLGLRDNPHPLLSRADCFVLSSNYEGMGLVLLEAMALDIPIISTDIPGPRSVLANGGGHLVANTQGALTQAMIAFAAGELSCPPAPDLTAYREKGLEMFYHDVLGLPNAKESPVVETNSPDTAV